MKILQGAREIIGPATWSLGVHRQWEWVRLNLGAAGQSAVLELPEGELSFHLLAREDGTKIDRLFLTTEPTQRP